jgi:hypothetical protein
LASCSLLESDPETITYSGKITYVEGDILPTTIFINYDIAERKPSMQLDIELFDTTIIVSPDGSNEFSFSVPYFEKGDYVEFYLLVDAALKKPHIYNSNSGETTAISEEYDYDKYIDGKLSNWAIFETDQDYLDLHFVLKDTSVWWARHDYLND